MPTPAEHKTVQARILEYAEAIGRTLVVRPLVSREDAEQRRGFDPDVPPADRARNQPLFFDDLLDAKVREFKRSGSTKLRMVEPLRLFHPTNPG